MSRLELLCRGRARRLSSRDFLLASCLLNVVKFLKFYENLTSQNRSIIWDMCARVLSPDALIITRAVSLSNVLEAKFAADEVSSQPVLRKPSNHYHPMSQTSKVTIQTRNAEIHATNHKQLSALEKECEGCSSSGEHHRRGVGVSGSLDERSGRRRA